MGSGPSHDRSNQPLGGGTGRRPRYKGNARAHGLLVLMIFAGTVCEAGTFPGAPEEIPKARMVNSESLPVATLLSDNGVLIARLVEKNPDILAAMARVRQAISGLSQS